MSIGADQACEHLNKLMKIRAGLVGISNNAKVRQSFFMAAPELSCLSKEFNRYVLVWQQGKQCENPWQDCMGAGRRRSAAAGSSEARLLQGHNWSSQASQYWCALSPPKAISEMVRCQCRWEMLVLVDQIIYRAQTSVCAALSVRMMRTLGLTCCCDSDDDE